MAHKTFILPLSIVSLVDLKRVKRELDELNDTMLQTEIRQGGEAQEKLPNTSRFLNDIVDKNELNLLKKEDRESLAKLIETLITQAPVMHMSFSAEPSPKFLERLIEHLRQEIDPYTLVTVGLAPSIGAGCILRTTNKYFDLSLKQALLNHKDVLVAQLNAVEAKPAEPTEVETPAPAGALS